MALLIRSHQPGRVPLTLRDLFWSDPFFTSVWDDFHQVQENLLSRQERQCEKCSCKKKEEKKEKSTSEVKSISNENKDENPCSWLFSDKWMMPKFLNEELAKSNNLFQDPSDRQVVRIQDSKDKLTISLNVHKFKPEEIQINVKDGCINVEAKHEDKSEDGNRFSSIQFVRKYPLPKNAKPEAVVSNLSSDGILAITAPKMKELKNDDGIKVPINMSN